MGVRGEGEGEGERARRQAVIRIAWRWFWRWKRILEGPINCGGIVVDEGPVGPFDEKSVVLLLSFDAGDGVGSEIACGEVISSDRKSVV